MPLCSLYCNSLLGNLNARKTANRFEGQVHTLHMSNIGFRHTSNDDPVRVRRSIYRKTADFSPDQHTYWNQR
jgi:hypothetical protein